jgi:ketosteroid isomerase-like protein
MPDVTSDTTETRRVVAALYAAAIRNDVRTIIELMDPDIELIEAESLPNAGVHRGIEAVQRALAPVFEMFDLTHLKLERVVVDGEYGIGLLELPFRDRPGQTCPISEVWQVRNGRIIKVRPYYWDTAIVTA